MRIRCCKTRRTAFLYPSLLELTIHPTQAVGFTRSLAKTLKMRGQPITVNCICPGLVPTPLVSATMVEHFPQEKLTPVSTIVKAIAGFLDDDSVTGRVAECSSGNVIYREEQAFGDEDAEYIMSGRFLGEMSKKVDLAGVSTTTTMIMVGGFVR